MCRFLQLEQVHLAADLAVVSLGGFLEPDEMFGELFLVEPAGAVDAAELRILLVAAPVCARNPRELECGGVELARRSEVRSAAHIHPAVTDRKSVVSGKSVSVRVVLGGRRIIKKKN